MIYSSSSFVASSIPVLHNGVKSIIFKGAELLMDLFILKFCSLIAAQSDLLTPYFMFAEDYIQRWLFLSSRGVSRASLLVLLFSLLNILSSLYSTLLWGLDSPGYIFKEYNASVADYASLRKDDTPYVVQLSLSPNKIDTEKPWGISVCHIPILPLNTAAENLTQIMGSDLFKQGLNYTLTGEVDRGTPEIFAPTRKNDVGARIWLDADGFSVSADSVAMIPAITNPVDEFPVACVSWRQGTTRWNCTFNNTFSQSILETIAGRPEIHWDDASDQAGDSRYLAPSRTHNIWASMGAEMRSAAMKQVFTVTKGTRRHTFLDSTVRVTMLTSSSISVLRGEVDDLVRRSWSQNETERRSPLIDLIVDDMMSARDKNASFYVGLDVSDNGNRTVLQSGWGFFTVVSAEGALYSAVMATGTNITLLRSETLPAEVSPFQPCNGVSFQNEAFGGKVAQTDCTGVKKSLASANSRQVDTSAVLIMYGLGDTRSSLSSSSYNEEVAAWLENEDDRIESLLIARGYIAGVDPALVTVTVKKLVTAMSGLQLFLSTFPLFLAATVWFGIQAFADSRWCNTFLSNLVYSMMTVSDAGPDGVRRKLGYMHNPPDIGIQAHKHRLVTIDGLAVVLERASSARSRISQDETVDGGKERFKTDSHGVEEHNELTGREGLLSHSV